MNNVYVCELIYKNGEKRLVGPFVHSHSSTTGNAAAYGQALCEFKGTEVANYVVRMLESPQVI